MSDGRRASERLLAEKEALAREITERLYRELPGLTGRHGPAGREKCLQDIRYNLEHLAPAVDLERPGMFGGYVRWLDELLRARGVETGEVAASLRITGEVVVERFAPEQAAAVRASLAAGLDALGEAGQ